MNIYQRLRNKGIAMIEVLISSAVIGVGVVGTVLFMGDLTGTASYNKARDEAIAFANAKIETVNNIMVQTDYTNLVTGQDASTITGTNATFTRSWVVTTETVLTSGSSTALPRKKVTVTVSWTNPQGGAESVKLNTAVIWSDPAKAISVATDGVDMGGTYTLNNTENVFDADYNFVSRDGDDVTALDDCTNCSIVKRAECNPDIDNCDNIPCEGEYTEFVVDGTVVSYVCADENNVSGNAVTISGEVCYDERNANDINDLAGIQSGFGKCIFPATTVTDLGSWIKAGYVCFSAEPYRGNIGILGLASNFSKTTCPDVAREYLRYGLSSDSKFYADGITQSYSNQDFLIASMTGHDNCESKVTEAIAAGCSYDEPFNLVVENGNSITITGWISNVTNHEPNSANIVATTTGGHATDGTNCRILNDIDGFEDGYTCTVPASLDSDPAVPWSGTITATLNIIDNQGDVTAICSPTTLSFNSLSSHIAEDTPDGSGGYLSEVGCLNEDRVDGLCGSNDNANLGSAPSTNLCTTGNASAVSGTGPWNWSCLGDNGGSTSICSANAITNGTCGASDGQSFASIPSANLCDAGTASIVSGSGPWSWSCTGDNTGSDSACSANILTNASCGTSHGQNLSSAPSSGLCDTGTASVVAGDGPWLWSCNSDGGGSSASCSANKTDDGSCGSSHDVGSLTTPSTNLCSTGTASTVSGSGPWSWDCVGNNGGATASCSAPKKVNGGCGNSHGQTFFTPPSSALCSAGTNSSVSLNLGALSYNWDCEGSFGGSDASCSATASLNADGVCGSSNGQGFSSTPATNLCTVGTASTISGSGPWSWDCAGENGGNDASCSANLTINGNCGSSDGQNFTGEPSTNLCTAGNSSSVTGSGPWAWTCDGIDGGSTDSCSANLTINGNCGSSDGANLTAAPGGNLCSAGTASSVSGSGPWTWSCTGINDGSNNSCSANLKVNGSCGSSDGQTFGSAPSTSLCTAGTASAVTGSGPWNWACTGQNTGSDDSCEASIASMVTITAYFNVNSGDSSPAIASISGGSCTTKTHGKNTYYQCSVSVADGSNGNFTITMEAGSGSCSNLTSHSYTSASDGQAFQTKQNPFAITCP